MLRRALDGFRACGACPADSQLLPQATSAFARLALEPQTDLSVCWILIPPNKKKPKRAFKLGGGGIRTHGTLVTYDGFQDRSDKPLWHSSISIYQI